MPLFFKNINLALMREREREINISNTKEVYEKLTLLSNVEFVVLFL